MNQGTAVVVDPDAPGRLVLQTVSPPSPAPSEAVVRVAAVSLNRGEVRMALTTPRANWRPGWDLAGRVEQAATLPVAGLTAFYALMKGRSTWR